MPGKPPEYTQIALKVPLVKTGLHQLQGTPDPFSWREDLPFPRSPGGFSAGTLIFRFRATGSCEQYKEKQADTSHQNSHLTGKRVVTRKGPSSRNPFPPAHTASSSHHPPCSLCLQQTGKQLRCSSHLYAFSPAERQAAFEAALLLRQDVL